MGRLPARDNVDRCTVTQKKSAFWQELDVFVLLALNHQLLVIVLEANNSKEPKTPDQTSLRTFCWNETPVEFLGASPLQEPLCTKLLPTQSNNAQKITLLHF